MKIRYIKYWAFAAVLGMGTVSCEDFLNRPTEDNYNESNFYQNDEQCVQGVNYLYNSPWYDFQRGFIKVGEILSGNVYSIDVAVHHGIDCQSRYGLDAQFLHNVLAVGDDGGANRCSTSQRFHSLG